MKKLIALVLLLLPCGAAQAQWSMMVQGKAAAASTYSGPGDQAPFTMWWGMRAFSNAKAAAAAKLAQIRIGVSTTFDIRAIPATGAFDQATMLSTGGTDVTCPASISGTSLTITGSCTNGVGSAPHVYDSFTGTGIVEPSFITAIGTCGASSGSCTINAAQAGFSTGTITFRIAYFAKTLYDQTAGNTCTSASCDLVQTTSASQPPVIPNMCAAGTPGLYNGTSSLMTSANNTTPATGVASVSAVGERTSGAGVGGGYLVAETQASGNAISVPPIANKWRLYGTSATDFNSGTTGHIATDGVLHAAQGIVNGASSIINIDGTDTTGTVTNATAAQKPGIMTSTSGGYLGFWCEAGVADNVAFTGTQYGNVHTNQSAWYGTP